MNTGQWELRESTVKLLYFVGTKFRGLMTLDMFMDTGISGFQIIWNITNLKVTEYFVGILSLWITLPIIYTKLNVQQILTISQYIGITLWVGQLAVGL